MFYRIPRIAASALLVMALCICTRVAFAQIAPTTTATLSGNVSDTTGKAVSDAQIILTGPRHAVTQSDSHGQFVFVGVPYGDYQLSVSASALGTVRRMLSVQGDVNIAIQYEPASVGGLKTIASVNASTNAHFNVTPASLTQVNPIQEALSGQTSWRTILEQIPGVSSSGVGSGLSYYASIADAPLMPQRFSVDGALPYETATLFDDMPLVTASFATNGGLGGGADLNVFGLNGFGSADVVRGPGANAPSIVDSIGGSISMHAPGPVTNDYYTLSVSNDPYGGVVANAIAGVRWGKLSAVATYGVNDSPGPISSSGIPTQLGFQGPVGVNGQPFGLGQYAPQYLLDPRFAGASFPYYGEQSGLFLCCVNQTTAWSSHSGSLSLNYALSPSVTASLYFTGQQTGEAQPSCDLTEEFVPPSGYTGELQPGTYTFLDGSYGSTVPIDHQGSSMLEEKITAHLGRGILKLAALQNQEFTEFGLNAPTTISGELYGGGYICTTTAYCGTSLNPGTLTVFNGQQATISTDSYTFTNSDHSYNRDLYAGYSMPLGENAQAGVSFVKSYYSQAQALTEQYSLLAYGIPSSSYTTIPVSAISQTTNELRFHVGGNPSQKTSLDLSGYFVNSDYHVPSNANTASYCTPDADIAYSDVKYTFTAPRLGFVWHPNSQVAVRASAGGGFAQAPLADMVSYPAADYGPYYVQTIANQNLQPEKSFAFDLGTDVRLRNNTIASFDVYEATLHGQLYESTDYAGLMGGLPLYETTYVNLGVSRYEGVLVNLRRDVAYGVYWNFSGGLTRGYVTSVPAGFYNDPSSGCTNCTNLTVVPGVNFNGAFSGGAGGYGQAASIPYSQAQATFGYRWNSFKYLDVSATYFGNNNSYYRPAFVVLNGEIGYSLTKHVSLLASFRNITGIYYGAYQVRSPENLLGAPTIAGLPYPLYGEEYGPRTVVFTMNVR